MFQIKLVDLYIKMHILYSNVLYYKHKASPLPLLNLASCHEDVWMSGGTIPDISSLT